MINRLSEMTSIVLELNEAARTVVDIQAHAPEHRENPSWQTMMSNAVARLARAQSRFDLWQDGKER